MYRVKAFQIVIIILSLLFCISCDSLQDSAGNNPPSTPSNLFVSYIMNDEDVQIQLNWQSVDPENDTIFYDMYFGSESIPSLPGCPTACCGIINIANPTCHFNNFTTTSHLITTCGRYVEPRNKRI
jgi:hypothetical protein